MKNIPLTNGKRKHIKKKPIKIFPLGHLWRYTLYDLYVVLMVNGSIYSPTMWDTLSRIMNRP